MASNDTPDPGPAGSAVRSEKSHSCTTSASHAPACTGSQQLPNFQLLQDLASAQQMSAEEDPRAERRRERNRLAAARCRDRRRERAEFLRKETLQLENSNQSLRANISRLRRERDRLKQVLASHMTTHHGDGTDAVTYHRGGHPPGGFQGAYSTGDEAMALLQGSDNALHLGGSLSVRNSRRALGNDITYDLPQQPIASLSESRHRTSEQTNSW